MHVLFTFGLCRKAPEANAKRYFLTRVSVGN